MHKISNRLTVGNSLFVLFSCFASWLFITAAEAQIVFNEGNAVAQDPGNVSEPRYLDHNASLPYEGYDFGALYHSGNTNLPNAIPPGNPFPPDLSAEGGTQTTLIDGFDLNGNQRGFGRIQDNGGDWIELVVTNDHTDLRGYTFYWQDDFDDDLVFGELTGEITNGNGTFTEAERGAVAFSQNQAWANLRAGTVITITEQAFTNEIRDQWPYGAAGSSEDDTGHDYDLITNLAFEPFDGNDDWHINFHLDESVTLGASPADTDFFLANSDIEVSNEQWAGRLLGPENRIIETIRDASLQLGDYDVATDAITEFVGEPASGVSPTWADETGGGNIGNQEVLTLLSNPDSGETGAAYFEDTDFSSFGMPNLFNMRTDANDVDGDGVIEGDIVAGASTDDTTLSQVQDFSGVRNPVRENTYDYSATDASSFSAAASWQRANDNATPGTGPAVNWTARLNNSTGGSKVAQVSQNVTVEFVTVRATFGTMTLEIQGGSTLTVTGASRTGFESPGRVLLFDGGAADVNGTIDAMIVEAFDGGAVSGSGAITGDLWNSGGTVAAGSGSGGTLQVMGNFVQGGSSTLVVDISGNAAGEFSVLDVSGMATVDGLVEVVLDGFTPSNGTTFTVIQSADLIDEGISLTGAAGFSYAIQNGTDLVLSFAGTSLAGDFDGSGQVSAGDLNLVLNNWGQDGTTPPAGWVNDFPNGVISAEELNAVLSNWGNSAVVAVPEPSSLLLLLGTILFAAKFRHKG